MLPEVLSTDRTSLHEGQDRLAVVVDMLVQPDGSVTASELYRATVLNRAKLSYGEVSQWLEGHAESLPQFASVPGLKSNCACTMPWPRSCGSGASAVAR